MFHTDLIYGHQLPRLEVRTQQFNYIAPGTLHVLALWWCIPGPFLPAFNYAILPRDEEKQEYTMRAGGLRRVLVPPTLGYGSMAVDVIPANS